MIKNLRNLLLARNGRELEIRRIFLATAGKRGSIRKKKIFKKKVEKQGGG